MSSSNSPLLSECPPSLPAEAYVSADWFAAEQRRIWAREWVHVGRLSDMAERALRRVEVAGRSVLVARGARAEVAAFLNVCPHRGAEICGGQDRGFNGRLITCPYHAFAFDMTGALRATGHATPGADFDRGAHGLTRVAHRVWNGGIYLCLSDTPPEFRPDMGVDALDTWPMDRLVVGHTVEKDLACNWKVFWENYNECLHCPGIHPALSRRVPVYGQGVMSGAETDHPVGQGPVLEPGAHSWTVNGQPCGPVFDGLSADQIAAGHTFVTLYPSSFVVAHVDHVRVVTLRPLTPGRTRLRADWLFLPETLSAPGFDLANAVDFAAQVLAEDAAACEMNQRGLSQPGFRGGTLMPQEFDIKAFHDWVRARLGDWQAGAGAPR